MASASATTCSRPAGPTIDCVFRTRSTTSPTLVQPGDNALGALLGDGWFRRLSRLFRSGALRRRTALHRAARRSSTPTARTRGSSSDDAWRSSSGEIVYSDQQMGETIDARRRQDGWDRAGFDARDWQPVTVAAPAPRAWRRSARRGWPPRSTYTRLGRASQRQASSSSTWARTWSAGCASPRAASAARRSSCALPKCSNPGRHAYTANLRSAQCTDDSSSRRADGEDLRAAFHPPRFRYVEVTAIRASPQLDAIVGASSSRAWRSAASFECSNPLI